MTFHCEFDRECVHMALYASLRIQFRSNILVLLSNFLLRDRVHW